MRSSVQLSARANIDDGHNNRLIGIFKSLAICLMPTVRIPELNAFRKLMLETVVMINAALVFVNGESSTSESVGEGEDVREIEE